MFPTAAVIVICVTVIVLALVVGLVVLNLSGSDKHASKSSAERDLRLSKLPGPSYRVESGVERFPITLRLVSLEEGDFFEATVKALPHLVEYGHTVDEAYRLIIDSLESLRQAAKEQGRAFPLPLKD